MIYLQLCWPPVGWMRGTYAEQIAQAESRGKRIVTMAIREQRHTAGVIGAMTRARNVAAKRKAGVENKEVSRER